MSARFAAGLLCGIGAALVAPRLDFLARGRARRLAARGGRLAPRSARRRPPAPGPWWAGALALALGLGLAVFGELGAGLVTAALGVAGAFVGARLSLAAHPRVRPLPAPALAAHAPRRGDRRINEVVLARDLAGRAAARARRSGSSRSAPRPSATARTACSRIRRARTLRRPGSRSASCAAPSSRVCRPRSCCASRASSSRATRRCATATSTCRPNRTAQRAALAARRRAASDPARDPRLRHGPAGTRRARLRGAVAAPHARPRRRARHAPAPRRARAGPALGRRLPRRPPAPDQLRLRPGDLGPAPDRGLAPRDGRRLRSASTA